jgi:Galactose oxidase, central domain
VADGAQTILGTSEIYDVAAGTWSTTGSLTDARSGHTATAVGDGTVLVAGGYNNSGAHFDSAELYSAGNFTAAGTINTARFDHVGVRLPGNRVLIGAGTNAFTGALASIELYTAGTGWAAAATLASMSSPRLLTTGAALANGDVVFIGGYNSTDSALGTTETYRPSTNTWTTGTGTMSHPRYHAVAAALGNGDVLVVGGEDGFGNYRDAELYDPATTQFSDFCGMSEASAYGHTVTLLNSGDALVAGGHGYSPSRILGSSSLFDLTADAGAATDGGFTLQDASACDHPAVVILDSGSQVDASDDAASPVADAAPAENDGDVDANEPSKPEAGSDASSSEPESGGFAAGGGCRTSPVNEPGSAPASERESPVFFAGFAIFFVLIRSRRWQHFARRSRPFF